MSWNFFSSPADWIVFLASPEKVFPAPRVPTGVQLFVAWFCKFVPVMKLFSIRKSWMRSVHTNSHLPPGCGSRTLRAIVQPAEPSSG